uniref:Uncharacterized protein n=1 Tax=Panagrolaimus sp. JU765 TaxID=591449 RepID=A0AC34RDU7_9BILA
MKLLVCTFVGILFLQIIAGMAVKKNSDLAVNNNSLTFHKENVGRIVRKADNQQKEERKSRKNKKGRKGKKQGGKKARKNNRKKNNNRD